MKARTRSRASADARTRGRLWAARTALLVIAAASTMTAAASPAGADSYVPINGAGSSWSSNAIDQWRRNVEQYGMRVNYASTGSSDGRNQFKAGTIDFASSEIPYGLSDGGVVDTPPTRGFAYMPIVAGGTAFMYNLKVGGQQVTNLRLSGDVLTKIFTGAITSWDDKAIAADNPSLALPARKIVPVVRSDGSGSTAQFTAWMAQEHTTLWDTYCKAAGRSTPCGVTSNYPVVAGKGFIAQPNSQGVAGYVAQRANEGTITYVEYSYALKTGYPVAKILNNADYYVEPTASNVAVGLLGAKINTDKSSAKYLTQNLTGVYRSKDKRAYPLSSYSYIIVPTSTQSGFTTAKGKTLGAFSYYFLCEGQQQAEVLGYSPLPINLVKAGLDQVKQIPGVEAKSIDIKGCNNPTFSADGTNTLAKNAPMPSECDKLGVAQCASGTGGAKTKNTAVTKKSTAQSSGGTGGKTGTSSASASAGSQTDTAGDSTTGAAATDSGGEPAGNDTGDTGAGTGTSVAANYGGGPVVCEQDTGICTNVVAEPVSVDTAANAAVPTGSWIVIAAAGFAISAPAALSHLLRRRRRGTAGGEAR
ncbi:phosphate ABC transporter substrate-binding protein PstS [Rarobacter incanus]|uniref:Phosphate ABC transporter substrate-binding protein (PhoT family) n=1 Tax=Rarobacter incanus TaxID=153494 RepID=A0A542SRJ4_9MICO|nr:phosphate ABC transporter substrate-binding protein PstS [Rarobacter incanus]TQK77214.1 phosphate ABC transporter substrate-binding protein (PhoT family) [Rarobacter incanus]